MPPPGAENDVPKKAKFEKDFIVLSEFSEQVGPIPIQVIPSPQAAGGFDVSQFSVRILTTDFQSASGKFLINNDAQVILSEKQDGTYAYVHYFCLNDIHARGYVRQFCISYITSSLTKLMDNFEGLLVHFSEVTRLLKCGNHRVFGKDLEHHLADLEHTQGILEYEGWTEERDVETTQRYEGFDFGSENVPERDPNVVKQNIEETRSIMEIMNQEMHCEPNAKVHLYLEKRRSAYQKLHEQKQGSPFFSRKEGAFTSYVPSLMESTDFGQSLLSPDNILSGSLSDTSVSSEISHYEPQRVMAHIVHKFERRLRSLEDLSSKAYQEAMEKVKEIHRLYSRTELALAMEQEECLLLDPRSSLLTVGRVPVMNMLQDRQLPTSQPSPLLLPQHYRLSCKNTWSQPFEPMGHTSDLDEDLEDQGNICSGFDTIFMEEALALNKWPLYLDAVVDTRRSDSFFQYTDEVDYSSSVESPTTMPDHPPHPAQGREEGESHESTAYNTPQVFRTPEMGPSPLTSSGEEEKGGACNKGDRSDEIVGFPADADPNFDSIRVQQAQVHDSKVGPSGHNHVQVEQGTSGGKQNVEVAASDSPVKNEFHHWIKTQVSTEKVTGNHANHVGMPVSINSDCPVEVYSSSQGSWEVWGSPENDLPPISDPEYKVENPKRGNVTGNFLLEEDISAGLGLLEDSFNAHHHGNPTKSEPTRTEKFHPQDNPLLHACQHSPSNQNGFLPGSRFLGANGNLVMGSVVSEEAQRKLLHPDLRIASPNKKRPSPEFHLPVAANLRLPSVGSTASITSMGSFAGPFSPLSPGLKSVSSLLERTRWQPIVEMRGRCKLPFVSSVDHIEGEYKFKPGRGIFSFCKDNANTKELLYCLLHGRPLVLIGQEKDEGLIRRLVRTLWLFLPGQSSRQQVVLWQTTPLDVKDLSRVKLIGLSSLHWPGPHLQRLISYWDCTTGKIYTPPYNGELLKPIVLRMKDRKNEQVFLAHIHSVLLNIAVRAYVYYHAHCINNSKMHRKLSTSEAAPRRFHTVAKDSPRKSRMQFLQQQLGIIKSSDIDIIEYLVEIIREQQLMEWKGEGSERNDCPIPVRLHTRNCAEYFCKPKRPY